MSDTRTKNIVIACSILLLTCLAFLPSLHNGYVNLDDTVMVAGNKSIRSLDPEILLNLFTSKHAGLYNPIVNISYALEFHFFGLNPFIYHFTNLFLHILNVLLVYWIFFILTQKHFVPSFIAILFAVHPMHVESVAWISERKDVLFAFFYLSSIASYLLFLKKNDSRYYILSIFLFVLSLFSKSMAISLPIILLLLEFRIYKKISLKALYRQLIPVALSIIFGIISIQLHYNAPQGIEFNQFKPTALEILQRSTFGFIFYIYKFFIPAKLSVLYPFTPKRGGQLPAIAAWAPYLAVIYSALIFFVFKHAKKIFFGLAFFTVTILPVLQIIPVGLEIPADRYTYIPYIGLSYITAECFLYLMKLSKTAKYSLLTAVIFIGILFSYLTFERSKIWNSGLTLWNDAIYKHPNSAEAFRMRSDAYLRQGDLNSALADINKSLELWPNSTRAYNDRGLIIERTGNLDGALADFSKSIELAPVNPLPYYNRGNIYLQKNMLNESLNEFMLALKFNPESAETYNNIGMIYGKMKKYSEAIIYFSKALEFDPFLYEAYRNRAYAFGYLGKFNEAYTDLSKMSELKYPIDKNYYEYVNSKRSLH